MFMKAPSSAYQCLFLRASHFSRVFYDFLKVPICPTYLKENQKIKKSQPWLSVFEKKEGQNNLLMSIIELLASTTCPRK